MRLPMRLKTILLGVAVLAVSFFVSLKAMDWLSPRGTVRAPMLVELPPLPPAPRSSSIIAPVAITLAAIRDAADRAPPGPAQFQPHCTGCVYACRHSRRRRSRRAAHLLRKSRQSGVADSAERRHRLEGAARADLRDRRPGGAVAGNAADGNAQRDGLADGEGNRRGR